jgi:competence protein ComEA
MSQLPFTRRQALTSALALVAVLVLAGRFVVHSEAQPPGPPVETVVAEDAAPAEPPQLVVHVVGAVRSPGLYRLDEGSRVADAVALAGGAGPKADLTAVNLAAPLADGAQVLVPRRGEAATAGAGVPSPGSAAASPAGPLRLNTATLEQLDALPGVGPVTAQRIVQYREAYGPFSSVDELDAVPGIGPARLEQLRELVAP